LTLKDLETETLYLVFKYRVPNCIWIALQTIQTRPKQTGILTNDPRSVKPTSADSPDLFGDEKAPQSSRNLRGRSDTKGRHKFPVLKPLDALRKRNGHYRDKNLLVNTFAAHNQNLFCLREAYVFKGGS
jgi:hypothetical protein